MICPPIGPQSPKPIGGYAFEQLARISDEDFEHVYRKFLSTRLDPKADDHATHPKQ